MAENRGVHEPFLEDRSFDNYNAANTRSNNNYDADRSSINNYDAASQNVDRRHLNDYNAAHQRFHFDPYALTNRPIDDHGLSYRQSNHGHHDDQLGRSGHEDVSNPPANYDRPTNVERQNPYPPQHEPLHYPQQQPQQQQHQPEHVPYPELATHQQRYYDELEARFGGTGGGNDAINETIYEPHHHPLHPHTISVSERRATGELERGANPASKRLESGYPADFRERAMTHSQMEFPDGNAGQQIIAEHHGAINYSAADEVNGTVDRRGHDGGDGGENEARNADPSADNAEERWHVPLGGGDSGTAPVYHTPFGRETNEIMDLRRGSARGETEEGENAAVVAASGRGSHETAGFEAADGVDGSWSSGMAAAFRRGKEMMAAKAITRDVEDVKRQFHRQESTEETTANTAAVVDQSGTTAGKGSLDQSASGRSIFDPLQAGKDDGIRSETETYHAKLNHDASGERYQGMDARYAGFR